ncbi:TraR/DksA family transcriptional regulator [Massilia sp. PAMC28688]|uniref:TraR/DksA family transcriptional regulator n=1 Tax=Massilia sp. PAMC28688 TaxID=2861283 RepID=UPI001C636B5B|nr:TraR/DksA family transcriptional regulator [Massilia sp. PAMC28688]QYF93806.1 TraR/DksA family transcriptional regulator [Massilia sp. PAMC28688]
MNGLDATQLALLTALLERRHAELNGQERVHSQADARELAVQEIETSPADKATVRLLNELAQEAAGLHHQQLRSVRHALAKIADGSFGQCEECGHPIGFSRLQARPEARLCIACQTRAERP